jgi:hypothetical protein
MESGTMAIVLVKALIENLDDVKAVEKGLVPAEEVRRIEVDDARGLPVQLTSQCPCDCSTN